MPLAGALTHDLLDHFLTFLLAQPGPFQRFFETRAGVGQLQVFSVVVDMPDVSQREDRFAAIALATGDRRDGAGRRDGGLGSVADAVLPDAALYRLPLDLRPAPGMLIGSQCLGGCQVMSSMS